MLEYDTIIQCSCGGHALEVWADLDDPPPMRYIEISFWQDTHRGPSWKEKIRHIWRILTTGTPYTDMVALSPAEAEQLIEALEKARRYGSA